MGFKFRKSIKIAPGLKLNLNKKSAGLTFGGKGFNYTVNSKGKRTASVGIPGSGLSYSSTSGGNSSDKKTYSQDNLINEKEGTTKMKNKSSKKGCLPAIIISVIIFGIIGSCGTDSNETNITTTSAEIITEEFTTAPLSDTAIAIVSTTDAETTQADTKQEQTTTKKETTTENQTTTTKKATTTKKEITTKKVTTTKKATTTKQITITEKNTTTTKKITTTKKKVVSTKASDENSHTIYRTKSGKKYHYENPCGNGKYYEVSLDEALAAGLEPCEKCVLH